VSWQTHPWTIALRRLGRTAGLNRAIAVLLNRGEGYESRFRDTMLALVREGDCVWDVGANAGYYSKLFAQRVGQRGRVFAFEPDPRVLASLEQSVEILGNVTLVPVALADRDGTMRFRPGLDAVGATGQLIDADRPSAGTWIEVPVLRGDSVVAREMAAPPNVVKIDVEGFELEVLRGLATLLDRPSLRAIGVEVHFALLDRRGRQNAPREIERMLHSVGFFRCCWADYSHLVAVRAMP
jgi:FkbM family methyltransferase